MDTKNRPLNASPYRASPVVILSWHAERTVFVVYVPVVRLAVARAFWSEMC
ncbi:hypothetical protein JNJ66_04045 [Candidatus Saccharibacteria bacterium]|nr:hypothetical protein [Candidatus Saccharibacteria bacterium]